MPVPLLELTTSGPDETRAFAAALAPLLQPGDVVALSGDLGAGKTCVAQGAIRGLGVDMRVTSPTFVLVRHYEGRLPIVHCDVYRLDRLQDVHDLGDDVLAPEVVTFLEWADAVRPLLPDDRLEIELHVDPGLADPTADEAAIATAATSAGAVASAPGAGSSAAGIAASGVGAGLAAEDAEEAGVADLEERRTATVRGFGPRWTERADALTEAVRPWLSGHHGGAAGTHRRADGGDLGGGMAHAGAAEPEPEQPEPEDR